MSKGTREILARLLTGLFLFVTGAIILINLSFKDLPVVMAWFALVAGIAWLLTLLP